MQKGETLKKLQNFFRKRLFVLYVYQSFLKKQSFIKKNTSLLKLGNTMQVFMKKHSLITSVQSSDTLLTGCIIVYGGPCPLSQRPRAELPPEPQEGGKK